MQDIFIIEEGAKRDLLKAAGHDWKNFKSYLTTTFINKGFTKYPPEKYNFIEQEVWDRFVFQRSTVDFQVHIYKHKHIHTHIHVHTHDTYINVHIHIYAHIHT